jgi:hypothetical protein
LPAKVWSSKGRKRLRDFDAVLERESDALAELARRTLVLIARMT